MLTRKLFTKLFLLLLCVTVSRFAFAAEGHPLSEESLRKGLPDKLGTDWRAITPSRQTSVDKLPEMADAKLVVEYGLQTITERQYAKGSAKVTIEAFEMKYASGAYGLWTFYRGTTGMSQLWSGQYVFRFSGSDQTGIDAIVSQLEPGLPQTEAPLLPTYLPEQSKIPNSEKYLVGAEAVARLTVISDWKDAIDFTGGTHAAIADYNNGNGKMSILLVEFQSPQFAVDGMAKMQTYFNVLSQDEQKKRILRRVGNYAVVAVNVADPKAAEEVLKQVKYMVSVHWEGKSVSDIPVPFRPPDPVALREAIQTGQFIVAVFYWIGVLLVGAIGTGIFAGGIFFYWRRMQQRRLGLEGSFSDAGGMTRLNLDDYLLSRSKASTKLLGKGE